VAERGDNGAPLRHLAYDVVNDRRLVDRRVVAVTGRSTLTASRSIAPAASTSRRRAASRSSPRPASEWAEIHLPGAVKFTFGGPDGNVLFITADAAIWAAVLTARGA